MILNRQAAMMAALLGGGLLLAALSSTAGAAEDAAVAFQCPGSAQERICHSPEAGVIVLVQDEIDAVGANRPAKQPDTGQVIKADPGVNAGRLDQAASSSSLSGGFDTPFEISAFEIIDTSRPFAAGNYSADGLFRIAVADGSCAGTFTVNAAPVSESGPAGSTPPTTTVTTYIGFPAGNFLFDAAGAGDYLVTVTETGSNCAFEPDNNPQTLTVLVGEGPADEPYDISVFEVVDTSRPFAAGNYSADGRFRIAVADGSCVGTFTVNAAPVSESGPAGSTPPTTTVTTYIGFPAGNFLFDAAGAGDYLVTVTETGSNCGFEPGNDQQTLTVSVGEGPLDTLFAVSEIENVSPSEQFASDDYVADGSFRLAIANGSCQGTYTINAQPVSGSGPAGSTPPTTTVTTYIGFPAGNYLFDQAGAGDYTVTTTETSNDCVFEPDQNPMSMTVSIIDLVPEIVLTPISVEARTLVDGDSVGVTVRIENVGARVLNWAIDAVSAQCDAADWLNVGPLDGSIDPDGFQELTVMLDPAGLDIGQYDSFLCVASDDFERELISIPVSFEVRSLEIFQDRFEQ